MARPHRFLPAHLASLMNLTELINLLDETLDETVQDRIKLISPPPHPAVSISWYHLRHWHNYTLRSKMCGDMRLCLGYWMRAELDYPLIGMQLQVYPKSKRRADIIRAMREIDTRPDWEGNSLNDPKAWCSVFRQHSLEGFLSEENHVEAIRNYFLESLDELENLVAAYPILLG